MLKGRSCLQTNLILLILTLPCCCWRISASRGVIKGSSSSELPLPWTLIVLRVQAGTWGLVKIVLGVAAKPGIGSAQCIVFRDLCHKEIIFSFYLLMLFSLVIRLKLHLLLTEKIKWTYNECCVLSLNTYKFTARTSSEKIFLQFKHTLTFPFFSSMCFCTILFRSK